MLQSRLDSGKSQRRVIRLSSGEIEYVDTGGSGDVVVLLHGVLMDEELWLPVVERLPSQWRCVVPVLPLGAHRIPRAEEADQSPVGVARLVGELIRSLDRGRVTLIGYDTGGALAQLLVAEQPELVDRLVLVSCDGFDNSPPGVPAQTMATACAKPGGQQVALASRAVPLWRRLPMSFGWMTKRPIAPEVFDRWLAAFDADQRIALDARRFLSGLDRQQVLDAVGGLHHFRGQVLIVWAAEDQATPVQHAHHRAATIPNGRTVLLDDCRTPIPLDQPEKMAAVLHAFLAGLALESSAAPLVPGKRQRRRWYDSTGLWCIAVAIAHLATTGHFYGESLRELASGPLFGALDADPQHPAGRGAAFWYAASGAVLLGLGWGAQRAEAAGQPPGKEFAVCLTAMGLVGIVVSPVSGFWLILTIGLVAAVRRRTFVARDARIVHAER